jgi:hypothetical protein
MDDEANIYFWKYNTIHTYIADDNNAPQVRVPKQAWQMVKMTPSLWMVGAV